MPIGVAGYENPNPHALGLRRQRRQQRPSLKASTIRIVRDGPKREWNRHKMIKDERRVESELVGLSPDSANVIVAHLFGVPFGRQSAARCSAATRRG